MPRSTLLPQFDHVLFILKVHRDSELLASVSFGEVVYALQAGAPYQLHLKVISCGF